MSLDMLKNLKAKKELKIYEFDLLKEVDSNLKFKLKLPDVSTYVDHSKQTLATVGVIIPIFRVETLIPIAYNHVKNGQVVGRYSSYANWIDYEIDYKKGNIMKIVLKKGVTVLKSDEKFFHHIAEEETAYHFEYLDDEENRWKLLADEKIFEDYRKTIEDAINSEEVSSIIQGFFDTLDTYLPKLTKLQALDAPGALDYIDEILKKADKFMQLQSAIGGISNHNYNLIKEKQIDEIQNDANKVRDMIAAKTSSTTIKDGISIIKTKINNLFTKEGYWLNESEPLPNFASIHLDKQKAKKNRTPEHKRRLKDALKLHYKKFKKEYISDVESISTFVKNYEEEL